MRPQAKYARPKKIKSILVKIKLTFVFISQVEENGK